jgi:hypothetical protein
MVAKKKSTEELSVNDQPTLRKKVLTIKNGSETGTVTESAFKNVWKDRGWTVTDDEKSGSHKAEPKKETD